MRWDSGPPERDEGRATPDPADTTDSIPAPIKTSSHLYPNGTRRRRAAARRSPPLAPCSCIRDPLTDRHYCGGEITDKQLQGAIAAAHHILGAGYLPIFDLPTLRALWKSGHHQLVDELCGGDL
jgi:hypothetical protein